MRGDWKRMKAEANMIATQEQALWLRSVHAVENEEIRMTNDAKAQKRGQDATSGEGHVTAAILVIGDEILSGRTKDKNIGYMADHFTAIGIDLREIRIVPDVQADIVEAVNTLRASYDYLFTTGGIGPTHDDITADAIAKAFGVSIDYDERAVAILESYYKPDDFGDARRRMARIPDGADLIENSVSRAPGFWLENVIVMAGVPEIMQVMLDAVTPKLKKGRQMHSLTIEVGRPESTMAELLRRHQDDYQDVSMGSYPYYRKGVVGTNLVLRSTDRERLREASEGLLALLKAKDIDPVDSSNAGV